MQAAIGKVTGYPEYEPTDLSGRVALVTGGALGIGYEISRALALAKARVIMVNRKEDQGDEAVSKIKNESNGEANIIWIDCDLGNLKQVKEVFDEIRKKEQQLDILICNAGTGTQKFDLDYDGIESQFGVNWLGHFLAINCLYPLLRTTSKLPVPLPSRIIFQSPKLHQATPSSVKFESLSEINDSTIEPEQLYGRTKIAMILGAKYGLVEHVIKPNGDNVYALAVHPGTVNTDMQEQWKAGYGKLFGSIVTNIMCAVGRTPVQGAATALYAATSSDIVDKNWNGAYLDDPGKLGSLTPQAEDAQLGEKLWTLSAQIIKERLGDDGLLPWDALN